MSEILTPEVEVMDLESSISTALIKANITDQVLAEIKERYGKVRLKNIDDKESYLECKAASKEIRKIEIAAEKICEHGRSDAIKIQRLWISKQKELLAKTAETKEPIDADIKRFEDEVERKELAEKKRQEEIYINRQTALSRMGATYDNGSYVLNHISYEVDLIKAADNEQWNDTIYPKYKKVYEENQAALVEEENKRKAEMELAKKQREEFELQQAEFKQQQELFAKQQSELKKQMDDAEREKRLVQERQEAEERRKKDLIIDTRMKQLRDLGMTFNFGKDAYVWEDVVVTSSEVETLSDNEWESLVTVKTDLIHKINSVLEAKRVALAQEERQAAIQKALEDEKIKQEQEKQQKEIEMAQANDKGKYADVVSYLKQVPKHEMKSSLYKSKMRIINDFIQDL